MGGTDTGTTVLDGLVAQRELSQVVANHLSLDFDLREEKQDDQKLIKPFSTVTSP